jgi:hypothetical protein
MWIWPWLSPVSIDSSLPGATHNGNIKFVEISPALGFGLDDVYLLENEWALVPDIGQH